MGRALLIFFIGFLLLIAQSWAGVKLFDKLRFAKKHEKLFLGLHILLMTVFGIIMVTGLVSVFINKWWLGIIFVIIVIPILAELMNG